MLIRYLIVAFSLMLLSACVTGGPITNNYQNCTTPECKQHAAVQACTVTANSYPYVRDQLLYEEYGALFTDDAVFQIEQTPAVVGRAAIVQALKKRGPATPTRHMNHVVSMQALDDSTASGISYGTVWRAGKNEQGEPSKSVSGPWLVVEYHDDFRIEAGRCVIAKRLIKIIFEAQ